MVTAEQIVIAAEISTESRDTANLQPMVLAAQEELRAAEVTDTLKIVLADAGDWTNNAIEALAGDGVQPLVAPDADRRKEPRPGRTGGGDDHQQRGDQQSHDRRPEGRGHGGTVPGERHRVNAVRRGAPGEHAASSAETAGVSCGAQSARLSATTTAPGTDAGSS
jgi:hypothetical protein